MTAELAAVVDDLYRDVVLEPEGWSEAALSEWLEAVAIDHQSMSREQAKHVRRALRIATKLQSFWISADSTRRAAEPSWRARVDIAVGLPAWRPGLELAMIDLEKTPTEERFGDVRQRFRIVNGTDWLEGTSYADWLAAQGGRGDGR